MTAIQQTEDTARLRHIWNAVTVIELWPSHFAETQCHRCDATCWTGLCLPVRADTAEFARADYEGEWGGVPCCPACYEWWEKWTSKP